jgi:PAS domain S-box-containing protein
MANGDGWIFWYNQRWYEYTGTTPEQMEGWGWQSVHDPETLPKVVERWKTSIATGEPLDMVFPLKGADGHFRYFLTRVMPVKDKEGKVVRWFGTNTDITEQRESKESLRLQSEQLRALSARLQQVREEERTMVARDLHDQIGQILTAIKMDVTWMARHLPKAQNEIHDRANETIELINDGVRSVRKICSGLRPGILDDLGLAAAIEWQASEFASRTRIPCQVSVPPADLRLDGDRATAVFRIFQEALTNVIRHAEARAVRVSLYQEDGELVLIVEDDGKGFYEAKISGPLGLLGMKERAQMCGGEVQISSSPGKGTTVTVRVPLLSMSCVNNHEHPDSR